MSQIAKRNGGGGAQNARRHGVFSDLVPRAEKVRFESGHAALLASLCPVGALEERLLERIALTFHKLERLQKWEAAQIERVGVVAEHDLSDPFGIASFISSPDFSHLADLHTLPDLKTLESIVRYEAHLERSLYRSLHELEALQDKRRGLSAPLARLEMHGPGA